MIDIRTAIERAMQQLGTQHEESRLDAELLLIHVINKNRAYLYAHPEVLLSQEQLEAYQQLVAKRAAGTPIAYLTGFRDFWSLNLKVNEHTLIPRHETELLVELILDLVPDLSNTVILDMGTGSGAIALAIAQERPHWKITACDFSQEALKIAEENAERHKITNISFYHSDWFEHLPPQKYHAIVSNPPYIAEQDPHLNQGDIRFEPLSALASGQEGLADLQYIIQHSFEYLLPDGLLLLEHGYDQKSQLRAILDKSGYKNVRCWQDIQGQDRVSGGKRP
ncbi:peptide chain release factor N(5)-glutamine methyltransferase [uncultured Legionella sp.]|uniref:peptide chain release factor N(5)-glutamine methyltransferase n=1 Tax=uncultured Legionella sp. TaxID=210934 RepID=UPI002616B854|nr:peptide chain release factor N(5)-glutamine methyltransferase [uncultured Legionella sp.]